jgi:hypothetical protein
MMVFRSRLIRSRRRRLPTPPLLRDATEGRRTRALRDFEVAEVVYPATTSSRGCRESVSMPLSVMSSVSI